MYSFDSRVRFSETDPNGQLSLPAVINYFQDCSEFQSDSLGTGVDTLGTHAWILNAWQVQFRHFPKRNDVITIATKPYQFKGIEGFRNFLIFDADGNVAINANSIWTYFDLQKQRPCRITDDQYLHRSSSFIARSAFPLWLILFFSSMEISCHKRLWFHISLIYLNSETPFRHIIHCYHKSPDMHMVSEVKSL